MGLLQSSNTIYLNVSCGKLVNKQKDISVYGVSGHIQSITEKEDEYEGKPIAKTVVKLTDKGETFIITFSTESWYAIGFYSRLEKIDFAKETTLGVSQSDQNEKVSFCWMKQGTTKIESDKEFPKPEKKKMGKKEIIDWTTPLEKFAELIAMANEKINSTLPEPSENNEPTDDLPY